MLGPRTAPGYCSWYCSAWSWIVKESGRALLLLQPWPKTLLEALRIDSPDPLYTSHMLLSLIINLLLVVLLLLMLCVVRLAGGRVLF